MPLNVISEYLNIQNSKKKTTALMLSTQGQHWAENFSKRHFKIFFLSFSWKIGLTVDLGNNLHDKLNSIFGGKNNSFCHLLNLPRAS